MVKKARENLQKAKNHIYAGSKEVLYQMRKNLELLKLKRKLLKKKLLTDKKGKRLIRKELEELRKQGKRFAKKEKEIRRSIGDVEKRIEKLSKIYSELENALK